LIQARKQVGIKDLAIALDISIGTVDRALHNRPGISPMTRKRVLKMAETLGYRPNLAARFLKSNKRLTFSVNLPRHIGAFFDAVREGVAAAADAVGVGLEYRTCRLLGEGDVRLFEEALDAGTNGIIVAPGDPSYMKALIRRASQQNVPVVCVATDAPGSGRLTAISADSYTCGAVAAELLCQGTPAGGTAAVITGFQSTHDHAEKLRGFRETLARFPGALSLSAIAEAHDEDPEAFARTADILEKNPNLSAIYVSTANSIPVLRAIGRANRAARPRVVTTDLFPELTPFIRSGAVCATIYQRPVTQGRLAFESLYSFLTKGTCPPGKVALRPYVVMRSNLDLTLDPDSVE